MLCPSLRFWCVVIVFLCAALPSHAVHHLMQVEQIIGAVNGDTTAQAIQLRMRSPGQNALSGSQMWVYDAAGANPVEIFNFNTQITNGETGDRVLLTTLAFNSFTTPATAPDFTMANRIPDSYFAAGRLTFEEDDGTVLWSTAWGGAAYTGSNAGDDTNDDDGDFGPAFGTALPSVGATALLINLAATGTGTTNLADYALTVATPIVTNNARASFTVDGNPATITVLRPNDNDVVHTNDVFKIKWESSGVVSDKVRIELFDGNNKTGTIKKKTANDGKYTWTVPGDVAVGANYRVRIRDKQNGVSGFSEVFMIESH
ncbi:MAG: Ser-Thr-rich GPI-anchored membrane family protein [Candidatus Hydrogenedentes bacterium]|nr:Ser-Thr-rich GPI-anchored membrane family protein [Candidatus Hydrogenedentota bacterium]